MCETLEGTGGGRGVRKRSVYKVSLGEITVNLVCKYDDSIEMDRLWSEATTLSTLLSNFRERLKLKTYHLVVYADLICWAET